MASTTGTLTVVEIVDNAANGAATAVPGDFMIHVMNGGTDVTNSPAAGSSTGTPYTLDAGAYTVSERRTVTATQPPSPATAIAPGP